MTKYSVFFFLKKKKLSLKRGSFWGDNLLAPNIALGRRRKEEMIPDVQNNKLNVGPFPASDVSLD